MSRQLTLTLPPTFGDKTVEVESKRFSVGRTPENDLIINDSSLSRRHALIETFEDHFNLSDCGSSNGTFVNGRQIAEVTQLEDWDVLTFGGVGNILVRIEEDSVSNQPSPEVFTAADFPAPAVTDRPASMARHTDKMSLAPVIALAAAVAILFVAGLALLIGHGSSNNNANVLVKKPRTIESDTLQTDVSNDKASPNVDNSGSSDSSPSTTGVDSSDLSTIEGYASTVLKGISRDTHPVLTEKPLWAINAQAQRYKGSTSLPEQLRVMKRAIPQVSAIAKSNGLRTPMAVYVTLATMDRDGRGDPAQVAAAVCPALARMRVIFGDELANDSLLTVAALQEGASLQSRITKLAGRVNDSPTTIRSIWYLHDHQVISDQTYNFLLRFLAIGVIAQDPQKFGITGEPLRF
jgi:hypothetical protein